MRQCIEVIEWQDSTNDTMVYRFPVANNEIKMGARLTVRDGLFQTGEITGQLRNLVVNEFTTALGELKVPVLDLASNYRHLSDQIGQTLDPRFGEYGLDLTQFLIENISVPPEVEAAMDKRS